MDRTTVDKIESNVKALSVELAHYYAGNFGGELDVNVIANLAARIYQLATRHDIAAAPRLLEALEEAHDRFELLAAAARNALALGEPYIDEHGLTQQAKNCEAAAEEIRVALQAARGEE